MPTPPKSRRAKKVMKTLLSPIEKFLQLETSSGITLILVTILTMIWANSPWGHIYDHIIELPFELRLGNWSLELTLHEWINDALMVIFFFVVGLEIKREMVVGELASPRKAALPMFAALGGMLIPALIYAGFNIKGPGHPGWGIPMATDIAFAVGIMSLMGKKVPFSLKVLLLALAIVDDLGAVLVIALFYTHDISTDAMVWAALGLIAVAFLRYSGIRKIPIYTALGVLIWFAVLKSGVHATVAGVMLGLMTPIEPFIRKKEAPQKIKKLLDDLDDHLKELSGKNTPTDDDHNEHLDERTKALLEDLHVVSIDARAPLDRLVHLLHPIVSFFVMPVFAFANAGVHLSGLDFSGFIHNPISQGVILGLLLGKPLGIVLFSWLSTKLKLAQLPSGVSWYHIICMGCLGGIGFTMALFVSHLALKTPDLEVYSKLGILIASLISAILGLILLSFAKDSATHVPEKDEVA